MRFRGWPGRAVSIAAVTALACTLVTTALPPPAMADSVTANHAWRIAQQYTGVWTSPPTAVPSGRASG